MPRRNKFVPGETITDISELVFWARRGGWFYMAGPRPKHPSFVMGISLNTLLTLIRIGQIRAAVPNTEEGNND